MSHNDLNLIHLYLYLAMKDFKNMLKNQDFAQSQAKSREPLASAPILGGASVIPPPLNLS